MSYKNGAYYIQFYNDDYGYLQENDEIVVCANESCSDITTYKWIRNGEEIFSYSEDDDAEERVSLIDALYALKHGVKKKSKLVIKDDLSREDIDALFSYGERYKIPDKFVEITNKATSRWWDKKD